MMSSSYDQLLKQVESLKVENSHLKRELEDNSSHLTTLENEAINMKDVLSHLHQSMDTDQDNYRFDSSEIIDNLDTLDQNSNSSNDENTTDQSWSHLQTNNPFRNSDSQLTSDLQLSADLTGRAEEARGEEREGSVGGSSASQAQKSGASSPEGRSTPNKKRALTKEFYSHFQELDQERNQIVQEIQNEDEHRKWYYEQMENIKRKIETFPVADQYNLQVDMTRRQLEFESQRLREMMQQNLGSSEQIAQRHEARLQRIRLIEAEMIQMQQQYRAKTELEKRDSGTCDHVEREEEDGVVVTDATTNTLVSGEEFGTRTAHEIEAAQSEHGIYVSGPNGSKLVTIATQTPEERLLAEQAQLDGSLRLANQNLASLYHGAWPLNQGNESEGSLSALANQETASVMSFNSSDVSSTPSQHQRTVHHQLGTKVEMVYSLLSMLGTHDKDDMSRTLLAMSSSQDSCIAMRQSGCLPLLIQLLHGSDKDSGLLGNTRGSKTARARAAAALHNIVHSHPDDKRGRREARVLRLLEQIRAHCDQLRGGNEEEEEENRSRTGSGSTDIDHHPGPAIAALMKLSFDEEHRHAICTLGGLQAIAELLQLDHDVNGNTDEQYNITMRRYACMALTNLTFGDGTNKALLCSMRTSMKALVAQLQSSNEDLRQVAASVLRNLSWRADLASKKTLREVGSVTGLMYAAMEVKKESTLKSILSALWNLSAHCSENKADICAVSGALAFLVSSLTFKSPSKTLAIIENGGGILRNISSHIAVKEDYRKLLRHHGCLQILLKHLRSPSLTIVSNACGTLWNLSARCPEDQKALWDMGAVNMLRNLVHSKHKMISMGSAAALKNLLSAKPTLNNLEDGHFSKSNMPGLHVRKAKALEAELDQNLSETCDNLETESPHGSPTENRKQDPHSSNTRLKYMYSSDQGGVYHVANPEQQQQQQQQAQPQQQQHRRPLMRGQLLHRGNSGDRSPHEKVLSPVRSVSRSASQDSVGSTHSDISHDRSPRVPNVLLKSTKLLQDRQTMSYDRGRDSQRSGGDTSSERGRIGANSRIMKVMAEVVMHASMDDGHPPYYALQAASGSSDGSVPSTSSRYGGGNDSIQDYSKHSTNNESLNNSKSSGHNSDKSLNINLSGLSQRMENLQLNLPESDQDEPIDYSMKYHESHGGPGQQEEHSPSAQQQRPNNQVTPSETSAFVKPIPKVQNYVGGGSGSGSSSGGGNGSMRYNNQSGQPTQSNSNPIKHRKNFESKKSNLNTSGQFSGYAETDIDQDQPTNFSIRYAEQEDNHEYHDDQPINYSKRYEEDEANDSEDELHQSVVEQRRSVIEQRQDDLNLSIHDDAMKTFCTEDTPFLSQATSLTDLSGMKKGAESGGEKSEGREEAGSDRQSVADSQGTGRNTGTTVVHRKQMENLQNNNISKSPPGGSDTGGAGHPSSSMYSYTDSTATSSPGEKPRQYCTEGTPSNLSRGSSLSSLHSSDAHDSGSGSRSSHAPSRQEMVLQSIDENDCLDISSNADVTLRNEMADASFTSANTTMSPAAHGAKSVTFDDNNQVQQTPLMFSRCSSLGSLSSFDAHSVHSSVVSEYSRRASEVVSPSDLPDSPGDTMPPSPSHRKSPVKFGPDLNKSGTRRPEETKDPKQKQGGAPGPSATAMMRAKVAHICAIEPPTEFSDQPLNYAMEDSPEKGGEHEHFSCGSSLSALTIDDEPIPPAPRFAESALLQENKDESSPDATRLSDSTKSPEQNITVVENTQVSRSLILDDGDSSVSEGEEDLLALCISSALPVSSKKKMKRSTSDSYLKKKSSSFIPRPGTGKSSSKSGGLMPHSPSLGSMMPKYSASQKPAAEEEMFGGYDSPKRFETEGTPLNFSRRGSNSDLSELNFDDPTSREREEAAHNKSRDDNKSDVSSIGSDDNEDLLSEAISAAMPTYSGKQNWKKPQPARQVIDRTAEGSESKEKFKYPAPNFQKKPTAASASTVPNIRQVHPGAAMPHHSGGDVMKTYADEGTPINFSRRTSLSDITDLDSERSGPTHAPQRPHTTAAPQGSKPPPDGSSNPSSFIGSSSYSGGGSAMDSPHVFGVEGTPVSFSRNDSLSDLSCCDEDVELNMADLRGSPPKGMKSPGARSPKGAGGIPQRKPGIQSPAIARLKTPGKGHIPPPTNTSTPMGKQRSPPGANKDSPKTYAVEDTPYCMSRNSSLSSLNSDDHEGLANQSGGSASSDSANATAIAVHPKDEGKFKVEDTPLCFSDNSSLSSLSVESLSFEPSETENAMLEECINLAMPKNKKKVKTSKTLTKPESNLLRAGPSGTDANRRAPAASSSEETRVKTEAATETTQPKNLIGPQAERETERRATQDEVVSSAAATTATAVEDTSFRPRKLSQEMDIRRKEEKDACNQEKLQAAAAAATCEETSTINDNKLAEELQEIEDKIAAFRLKGSETYDKDLCLEAVPIETSIEEEEVEKSDSHSEKRKRLTQMNSADSLDTPTEPNARSYDGDIMKESFPEMSSSIASTVMSDQSLSLSGSLSTFESNTVRIQKAIANSRAVAPSDDELDEPDDTTSDLQANGDADETLQDQEKEEKVKAHDMSAEDERALEENANIILSELSFTRELTDSALDEDIFIDNETISLVSNDCASDTASEASACLSVSSYTASEKGSEISCTTTLSQASEIAEAPKGPRIVKPGQAAAPEKPKEAVTGIRGRRRLLTAPRQISKSPAKPEANSPKGIKGGGGQKPKPITPNRITSLLKKTPTKTTPTKTIPSVRPGQKTSPAARTQSASPAGRGQTKVLPGRTASTPSPRGSNLTTTKTNSSSPKPTRTTKFGNSAKQITPPTKSGLPKSGIQKPGVKTTTSPKGADATKKTAKKASPKTEAAEVERPKPPIKQGTFTKDSPTQELIPIVSPGSEASPESPGTSKAEKTSPTGIPAVSGVRMREKRHSSASQRSRSSGESFSRKVLGDSSFDSDTSPRTPTKDSPTTPVGSKLRTSGSRTSIKSLPKAGSRTSLNKSPSGGSLHKTPSISSLNKGPKTPPRSSSLKQSDSASSLHKGAHSPRSTTPRSSIGGVKSNSPARGTTPTGRVAPNTRAVTPTAKTPTRAGSRSTTPTRPTSSRTSTTPSSTKSGLPNGKATTPPGQAPARKLSNTSTGSATSTDVKGKKPKQAVSKIAGLWRKEPKKQPESAAKTSPKTNGEVAKAELADNTNKKSFGIPTKSKKKTTTEPPVEAEAEAETGSGLKRSSTYDKLTPDTLAVANAARNDSEEDNVVIMVHPDTPEEPVKKIIPPAVPTRSNWRNTYTVPDGNFEVTDVTGAWATETAPNKADKQETPAKTTSSKKPSGISIWRKTEKKGKAAENGTGEPAPKKKGFSLWRKDVKKSKDAGPASSNEPSVRPVGVATVVSPIQSPTKPQASAIVQPYNYKPNHAQKSATLPANGSLASHAQKSATLPANGHLYNPGSAEAPQDAPSPTKHMTKTEMLMARRRRSYMTSLRSDESLTVSQESTSSDAQKASCLVTTV